jgi:hypothetical protein
MSELEQRFWSKVERGSPDECWSWTAGLSAAGYGRFLRDGGNRLAHRISYELTKGRIPDGLTLDHLCSNRACVNPAHLEPVTLSENGRRAAFGRVPAEPRTSCARGHPFDERNTGWERKHGKPYRFCRACKYRVNSEYKRRRRAAL